MDNIGAEVGQKMRSAIKAKLMELDCYVDDELPDYIMVMVANKRTKSQMNEDLNLFLSTKTSTFVNWLHIVLKKLKEVTVTNPEIYKKVSKRKSDEQVEIKTKKEKRDKKVKKEEPPDNLLDEKPKIKPEFEPSLEPHEEGKSLTDNLPFIAKSETRKVIITSNVEVSTTKIVYEDNFDIPLMSEIQDCNEEDLDALEKKIRSVKSRLGLLVESDEENPTTSTSVVNADTGHLEANENTIEVKNQRDSLSEENAESEDNRQPEETEDPVLNDSRQISILENEISESHNKELERLTEALEKEEKEDEPEESYTPKRKEVTDTDDISPNTEQSKEDEDKDTSSTSRKYPARKHERITFDPRELSPKVSPRRSAKDRLGRKSSESPDRLKRDRRKNSFYAGCEEEEDLRKADPHRDFKEWVALRQRDRSRSREKRDRSRDRGRAAHWERRGRSRERRDRSYERKDWSWGQRDNRVNSWNKGDKSWDKRNKSRDSRDRSRDGPNKTGETRNRSWDRYERTREGRNRSRSLERRNKSKSREDPKEANKELNISKDEKTAIKDKSKERIIDNRDRSRSKSGEKEPKTEGIQTRMVLSKVSVPEKPPNSDKSDDEQVKREVQSLVKVKRTLRTGRAQPNKNLLLRAVAEAQRSVAQAPKVGILSPKKSKSIQERLGSNRPKTSRVCRLMDNEKAKLKSLLEQTNKNRILQRRLNLEGCDSSDGEYVPKPVKNTRNYNSSQGEYVPKSMKKSVEVPKYVPSSKSSRENSEDSDRTPSPKHKFIITLDGIDKIKTELRKSPKTDKEDKTTRESRRLTDQEKGTSPQKSTTPKEKSPLPKLRVDGRKVPSPIVFSKKEFSSQSAVKAPKPNIPDKLPVVHPPLSIKNKERCKYWPSCRQGDKCEFVHPSQTCEKFPQCRNSDTCLYLHPKCKFGSSCTKKECPYDHNIAKPVSASKIHPPAQSCKFYPNCTNANCPFFHPKPCKYGKFCTNITDCPFLHNCPPKRSLSWTSK